MMVVATGAVFLTVLILVTVIGFTITDDLFDTDRKRFGSD